MHQTNDQQDNDQKIKINRRKKTCQIKGETFKLADVDHVFDLLYLVYDDKPIKGLKLKDEKLAWCLWGIGVLKPFKTSKRIFEPLEIRWRIGPNFLECYDYVKEFMYSKQSLQPV